MNIAAYLLLAAAITSEIIATSLLKSTEGFTRLWPTVACLIGYGFAFYFLSRAVATIPVGVAYALWSGLGTAAIVAIGVVFLGESLSLTRGLGVVLIIIGVVMVNLTGGHGEAQASAPDRSAPLQQEAAQKPSQDR